jgi:hypothetical protein
MPSVIIGEPTKNRDDDDKAVFPIHKNLYASIETRPDGVYVIGFDVKSGKTIFETRKNDASEALGMIEAKKKYFDKLYGTAEGKEGKNDGDSGTGNSGAVHSGGDE